MKTEFYVGYLPKMPGRLGAFTRHVVGGLLLFGVVLAILLILGQQPFPAASFEWGEYRSYEGDVYLWPAPILVHDDARYLLVAPGKRGVADFLPKQEGLRVRLQAARITRDANSMLELAPESIEVLPPVRGAQQTPSVDLGSFEVTGQIVDTKCYLGVMNPGSGKVHRACAVRCISGGVPPALLVRDANGESVLLLMRGSDGRALNREVLDFVAETIRVSGRVHRTHGVLTIQAEPSSFVRE